MENSNPGIQVNKTDLEYTKKVEEFLQRHRDLKMFSIMHKAYRGTNPTNLEIDAYRDRLYGPLNEEQREQLGEEEYDDEEDENEEEMYEPERQVE